jgi:hypothetical protein
MSQSFKTLIPLLLVSISAFIANPSQAQSLTEANNSNTNNISPISSEISTEINSNLLFQPNDLNKPDILSETSDTSSTNTAVTTTDTNSNPRIPISSRIFAVPSMQQ